MAPTVPAAEAASRSRAIRRPVAVGLSVVLHGALFYALSRAPWAVSEASIARAPPPSVVWLTSLRLPEPAPSEAEEDASLPSEVVPVEPEPPPAAPPEPPPRPRAARRPSSVPAPPVPAPEPVAPRAEPSSEPTTLTRLPRIDWDKERRNAVVDTLRQRESGGPVFSVDDIPDRKQELPVEPAPPPMTDHCAVYKNPLQAMMMAMMGRCVRDARGDLFAEARPAYLDEHPVCRETRPDSPGAVASDGRVISTVKCDLVAEDEADHAEPR